MKINKTKYAGENITRDRLQYIMESDVFILDSVKILDKGDDRFLVEATIGEASGGVYIYYIPSVGAFFISGRTGLDYLSTANFYRKLCECYAKRISALIKVDELTKEPNKSKEMI